MDINIFFYKMDRDRKAYSINLQQWEFNSIDVILSLYIIVLCVKEERVKVVFF